MPFDETRPIEAGFAPVFEDRIAPRLDAVEARRQGLHATAKKHVGIALGVGAVLAALFALSADEMQGVVVALVIPMAFAGVAAFFLWRRQAERWKGAITDEVMPVVCDFLGDLEYDREARMRFPLDRLQALGMIGSFNRSSLQDRLEGRYRDTGYEMVEAHLRSSTRDSDGDSSTKTVFKGLLLRISVPHPAPTTILIARNHGGFGNKLAGLFSGNAGRGMPKVETRHAAFETAFEVHADDPEAARDFLPHPFLDNLLAIGEAEAGDAGLEGMTAAFQAESFYLALKRSDEFMEMGGLAQPVHDIEQQLHTVFDDLALARRIIDRLHGDAPEH